LKNRSLAFFLIGLCVVLIIGISIGVYLKKQSRYNPYKALQGMPQTAKEHYIKGEAFYYSKAFDKAISEYKASIEVNPTPEAHCSLAVSYMEKNDFENAIRNLETSIQLNPNYPKSEYAMAVCYTRIDPPNIELAKKHYQKAKKLGYQIPEWFNAHLTKLQGE